MSRRSTVAALAIAVFVAAVPHALAISRYWNITPDSASLVGGGQSLAAGNGYAHLGRPIRLQPPGPSLIYAATLMAFPGGYLALRVAVIAFLMIGLALAFVMLRREVGVPAGLVIVAASLGSALVLQEGTRLLSEMFYLCFSMAALLAANVALDEADDWSSAAVLGIALLSAVMMRTIGLALPIAVLLCHAWRVARGHERLRPRMAAVAVAALAAIVVWDLASGRATGLSYFTLLEQKEIWVKEAGTVSPFGLAARVVGNVPELARIGRVLDNDALSFSAPLSAAVAWAGTALFALGLLVSYARGVTPTNVYVVVYLLVCLAWAEIPARFFVPIVPLVFLYAGDGLRVMTSGIARRHASAALVAVLALWGLAYARAGWPDMRAEIAEQHRSPLGDYPIKYRWNYDGERLALWLRDHTPRDTVYASPFPDVYDVISERQSVPLPWTRDPQAFLAALAESGVAYVLVSPKETYVREYVLPIVEQHPERFVAVATAPEAMLYAFRGP